GTAGRVSSAVHISPPSVAGARGSRRLRSQAGPGGAGRDTFATMTWMPTEEQVREALRSVIDPAPRRNIVELGMVRSIELGEDGQVAVTVSLTTPGCPIRSHFQRAVAEQVGQLEGVKGVSVAFDVLSQEEKAGLQQRLGRGTLPA